MAIFGVSDRYYFLMMLLTFPLSVFLIGLPYFLKVVHLKHTKTYIFTDRRVLIIDGMFSIKLTSAPYDKISHITVREDFFKNLILGVGDITIHTAGPTPVEIDIVKVGHPMQVKNLLEELMFKEKKEVFHV